MAHADFQSLRDYLSGRRRLYDLTQDAVASAAGVSRQTIVSWESGKTAPSIAQTRAWIAALPLNDEELAAVARLVVGGAA